MAQTRAIEIDTPLGKDLLFLQLSGREELGRLFEYEVELLSDKTPVDFSKVIGQPMTLHIDTGGAPRHICGLVSAFADAGTLGRYARYRATLRPWLWLLTKKADCRIFQQKTAPAIIKEVLREHAITFSESLSGSYATREYCVQYRETDFDFISRLMEEEGIYYFSEHAQSKLTMVLADSYSAHDPTAGYDEVPFFPQAEGARRRRDHIDTWAASQRIEPGACFLSDFDFERPEANLQVKLVSRDGLAKAAREIYDYPGLYTATATGENTVRVRLEEHYAQQSHALGEGDVRGLGAGALFALTGFPRDDQNREYLVVSATLQASVTGYESGADVGEPQFRCSFVATDSKIPFRSARRTPTPVVQGPQTAIVVGKSGEDIWTDEYGRVKVQFHWDRLGKSDESSSCWVRVAQGWAGNKWGAIQIPRIGHEVVVDFLEGNPDRPLVTGCVYNGTNKPPYALPDNQTQSGIKSRSSKGGNADNFNEIRFEDKKDSEQLFVQAEKDFELLVKNDRKKTIKHDEITLVENDRTETVKHDETITVEHDRTETVKHDETITVEGNRTETVKKDEKTTIEGGRIESVTKDEELTIQGKLTQTIGGDVSVSIGGSRSLTIGADDAFTVGGKLTLDAGSELTLKCGAASITLKASGEIKIKGVKVEVSGSGPVKVKSSAVVEIKGSAIKLN